MLSAVPSTSHSIIQTGSCCCGGTGVDGLDVCSLHAKDDPATHSDVVDSRVCLTSCGTSCGLALS